MQLFAGELTNQNREYYKVNDNANNTYKELNIFLFWLIDKIPLRHATIILVVKFLKTCLVSERLFMYPL